MDEPADFMGQLQSGELVIYSEYSYYPGLTSSLRDEVRNDDMGIVMGKITTVLGYTTYQVLWLRTGVMTNVARANLKLAYTTEIIVEELTKTDKAEIKRMIARELKSMVEDEVAKAIKSKDIKDDIGDISKKILKKLYKDMSVHHPYIIDRIKV